MSALTLIAHFDESGHPRDPRIASFTIGGSVGSCDEWLKFDRAWLKALSTYEVSWFHMSEFEAAKYPSRRHERKPNPYRGWKTERRHAFLGRLLDIIDEHEISHVATSQRLPTLPNRGVVDSYYTYHYRVCLLQTAILTGQGVVHFVFANQELTDTPKKLKTFTDYYGLVTRIYSQEAKWSGRLGGVTIDDPRGIPALQVADLVAYETGRKYEHPQCVRYPFERLRKKLAHFDLSY